MVCPYRKTKTYSYTTNGRLVDETELFADCSKNECPFYYENNRGAYPIKECKRVLSELKGVNNA